MLLLVHPDAILKIGFKAKRRAPKWGSRFEVSEEEI